MKVSATKKNKSSVFSVELAFSVNHINCIELVLFVTTKCVLDINLIFHCSTNTVRQNTWSKINGTSCYYCY